MITIINKEKSACELCRGEQDDVPGNENLIYVSAINKIVIMCDYCHSRFNEGVKGLLEIMGYESDDDSRSQSQRGDN